jgi:serine/threonine-protein kinase
MSLCGECQREAPQGAVFCAFCGAPLGSSVDAVVVGALAGATIAHRYFLESLIGRGGMGDVYRATDLSLDRTVVVKLLRRTEAIDEAAVKRFHREARAASRLSHPSSVALLDSGETEAGMLYMVMELVPGVTLARLLSERGHVPERRVVSIGAQVLDALAEAHGLGIVHRDLKPANVMVDVREGLDHVKVLDFGIATFGETEADTRVTQQGQVFGTPAYMSPEQVRGEVLDARSDLYSVGVLLYELLTGKLPFDAGSSMELAARHLTTPPTPMSERRPDVAVSPDLEGLVLSALSKERAGRPASAEAFRGALLACRIDDAGRDEALPSLAPTASLDGKDLAEAVRRSTGPLASRSRRPGWARRAGLVAAAAVVVASGAAASFAVARRGHAPDVPASTDPVAAAPAAPAMPASEPVRTPDAASPPSDATPAREREATPPTAPPPATAPAPRTPEPGRARDPAPAPPSGGAGQPADGPGAGPARPQPAEHGPGIHAVRGELDSLPLPAASSGDGLLAIEASPWAEVSVDGEKLGETPREVQLAAGSHQVRAVHPQLGVRESRITVRAGQRTVWVAEME